MTASASFTFTGAAGSLQKLQAITQGALVEATLDNLAGVQSVAWDIFSTDETGTSHTITTSGPKNSVAQLTAGPAGTAGILRCIVNGTITATAKWWVPASNGSEVGCVDETTQSDSVYHTAGIINQAIRNADTLTRTAIVAGGTHNAALYTVVRVDGTSPATINLPSASGHRGMIEIVEVRGGTSTIDIVPDGAEYVDSTGGTLASTAPFARIRLKSDGDAEWQVQ